MSRTALWLLLVLLPGACALFFLVEAMRLVDERPHAWAWTLAGGASGLLLLTGSVKLGDRGHYFFVRWNPWLIALGVGTVPFWALLGSQWRIALFSCLGTFTLCFALLMALSLMRH